MGRSLQPKALFHIPAPSLVTGCSKRYNRFVASLARVLANSELTSIAMIAQGSNPRRNAGNRLNPVASISDSGLEPVSIQLTSGSIPERN
jgi:hypothetical protein